MCGIVFAPAKEAIQIFNLQTDRGLDGLGFVYKKNKTFGYRIGPKDDTQSVSAAQYTKIYNEYIDKHDVDGNVVMHHRKASIGHKSLENVHPYMGKRFHIMQNGTAKDMRTWGDIEFIPESKSDTFCFLQYLENHCKTLNEIIDYLNFAHWTIGSIFICDFKGNILFYSDKTRESFIDKDDTMVTRISSKNPEDLTSEYYCTGYLLFNIDGTIIDDGITILNEKKIPVPKTTYPVHYAHQYHDPYTPPTYAPPTAYQKSQPFTDPDDLLLFLVECDGMLSKKINKLFPIAYEDFMHNVYPVTRNYSTIDGVYESDQDRASHKWKKRHKKLVTALYDAQIYPRSCTMSKINRYGGVLAFRAKAEQLLAEIKKGRISKRNQTSLLIANKPVRHLTPPIVAAQPDAKPDDTCEGQDPDKYYQDLADKQETMTDYLERLSNASVGLTLKPGQIVQFNDGTVGIYAAGEQVQIKDKYYYVYTDSKDLPGAKYINVREKFRQSMWGAFDYQVVKKYILSAS